MKYCPHCSDESISGQIRDVRNKENKDGTPRLSNHTIYQSQSQSITNLSFRWRTSLPNHFRCPKDSIISFVWSSLKNSKPVYQNEISGRNSFYLLDPWSLSRGLFSSARRHISWTDNQKVASYLMLSLALQKGLRRF